MVSRSLFAAVDDQLKLNGAAPVGVVRWPLSGILLMPGRC